ncbi:hypothetical protein ABT390_02220 [Streptomyces aurantiacus]|uniref:Uncharacterized protein n=1 Tax=Streptomyces aurantiacus JA 4570 TaxID=1286094 RepID=S3ZJS4_9ACTN|nr:hypothetical protein [Streptomyces aurantiacus]EPH43463.1 hypothetical protein STRAU_3481 [Streptomyces aurantiacus JA 4570]
MRTARKLTTSAALAVTSAGLLAAPASAANAAPVGGLEVAPATVTPGTTVTVRTTACGADGGATGDASAVGAGTFALAPAERPEVASGRFKVPPSAQPGTYEIVARCAGSGADGGKQVAGDLSVTLTSTASAREEQPVPVPVHPRGHVKTGVGGALGPDPVKTAAGVAVLAVAAAGGTWLLHRRARGDRI